MASAPNFIVPKRNDRHHEIRAGTRQLQAPQLLAAGQGRVKGSRSTSRSISLSPWIPVAWRQTIVHLQRHCIKFTADRCHCCRSFAGEALERERFGMFVTKSYQSGLGFATAKANLESINR